MSKVIRKVFKTDKFSLHECTDGYYLYDYEICMNISMRAKTEQDAFIEALTYYQGRLKDSRTKFKDLSDKVENFISQFDKDDD